MWLITSTCSFCKFLTASVLRMRMLSAVLHEVKKVSLKCRSCLCHLSFLSVALNNKIYKVDTQLIHLVNTVELSQLQVVIYYINRDYERTNVKLLFPE